MKLDRKFVSSVVPPADRAEVTYWDEASPGLGLRVLRSGAKSWIVRYRVGKKQKFTTLGRADDLKIEKAREIAATFRAKAKLGQDPGAEVEALRAAASDTLDRLIQDYLERHVAVRQRPRSQVETRRYLLRCWGPLHKVPVPDIDRRCVARELHRIFKEHGGITANRARSSLSALFAWAIREGLTESNPVIGTNKVAEERSRERVLDNEELRAIWRATARPGAYDCIVRLLMLTGCRRDEIGKLSWREVDLGAGTLTIPAARTKNGRPHAVPLAEPVRAILDAVPRVGELIFGQGSNGFGGWAGQKERLDKWIMLDRDAAEPDRRSEPLSPDELGRYALSPWRLHDLRRTVATRMADLGVEPHVIEEILGHVGWHRSGVAGTYNRASYDRAKRAALSLWADRLMEIVGERPAVVVPLRAVR